MKKQPLRWGVASIVAATLISVGVTAPTAGAAPAVKQNTQVQYIGNQNLQDIASRYGINLNDLFKNIQGSIPNVTMPYPGSNNGSVPAPGPKPTPVVPKPTPVIPKPTTPAPSKPSTNPGNNTSATAFQNQVVELVNQERAKAGLPALKSDALLTKVAVEKAKDMHVNNYFSHTSPTYGSPFDMMHKFGVTYSSAGENIASGQRSPEEVMKAWMNSPGHRANILKREFTKIGVGYYNGKWAQEFTG